MANSDIIVSKWEDAIVPAGGSLTVADTTNRTGLFVSSISVNADTVLDTCTGFDESGVAIDFLTDARYLWTGTLLAGSIKFAGKDRYVNVVKLTSGNVDLGKVK